MNQNNVVKDIPEDFYYTDAITDKAMKYIQDHRITKTKDPFFLYVSYTSPHRPLHAQEEDIKKYKGKYDAGWDQLREQRYQRMIQMGLIDKNWQLTERDPGLSPWDPGSLWLNTKTFQLNHRMGNYYIKYCNSCF